jgi:hypothetical protein
LASHTEKRGEDMEDDDDDERWGMNVSQHRSQLPKVELYHPQG